MPTDTFATIDPEALSRVSGGTTSNDQITAALSQITQSLSALSANRNQSDPTMMMMMMMMMMGGGGAAPGHQRRHQRAQPRRRPGRPARRRWRRRLRLRLRRRWRLLRLLRLLLVGRPRRDA